MKFKAELGFWDSTFFEIGGIVGAGIFVLIGLASQASGPAVVVSVALAGLISLATAFSYAELSSAFSNAEGGDFEFAHRLVSPLAGILVALGWIVADVVSSGVVALGFAGYLTGLIPALSVQTAAVLGLALVTLINLAGIRQTARTNNLLSLVKIGVLLVFAIVLLTRFEPANFEPFTPQGINGILLGAGIFFFAFSGFGKIARLSEEVKKSKETLPKVILGAVGISIVLYLLVSVALVGAVGIQDGSAAQRPLAFAATSLGFGPLALLVSLGALVATFSVLLTNHAGVSRIVFALGRRHKKLAYFSKIHPEFKTPWRALILTGAISALLVYFVKLNTVAVVSSFLFLVYYGLVNAITLYVHNHPTWKPKFKTPFFPLFPVIGMATCIVLLFTLVLIH